MAKVDLEKLKKEINKNYGEVAKTKEDIPQNVKVWCSTGSFSLDLIIGCGGTPKNRIEILQGPPSGGKTLMALIKAGQIQKANENNTVGFIDLEGTYTHDWASKMGVNLENLLYVRPESGGDALGILESMVEGNVSFIVVDSVSALVTEREINADYDQDLMANLARLLSTGLKKINNKMVKSESTICFINQVRANITSIGAFGDKGTGGKALEHYASIIMNVKRKDTIGDKDDPQGFVTTITVKKNKVGPPLRSVDVNLYIGPEKYGIDKDAEVIDIAIQLGIIERQKKEKDADGNDIYISNNKGSHYQYKEERFYGKPKMISYIEDNPEEKDYIVKEINDIMVKKDKPADDSFRAKTQGV